MKRILISLLAVAAIAACAPSDGPTPRNVVSNARKHEIPILPLSEQVVAALGSGGSGSGLSGFGSRSYVPGIIKPGDIISVSVFDTGETGLFSASTSSNVDLGEYAVSPAGTISLPFVGTMNVGGRSTTSAQEAVTAKFRETSVNPYATVQIARKDTDAYSVQGGVREGGLYSLTARSERVLDGIAAAGGSVDAPEEAVVTLIRGGHSGKEMLADIMRSPSDNVALQPGDTIVVSGGEASFTAEGALVSTGEFRFVEGHKSLGQAIAQAGGLSDARSNPRAVFVFRRLAPGESIVVQDHKGERRVATGDLVFRANFKDTIERMRANRFQMRDGDAIYVGNAPLANFSKYFQIFNTPPETPAVPDPQL